jgi:hypothetical protein
VIAGVNETLVNEGMMLQERRGAIADKEVHRRIRKRVPEVLEQCRREHDIAKASELDDEYATRMRDERRLHSCSVRSVARWRNARGAIAGGGFTRCRWRTSKWRIMRGSSSRSTRLQFRTTERPDTIPTPAA